MKTYLKERVGAAVLAPKRSPTTCASSTRSGFFDDIQVDLDAARRRRAPALPRARAARASPAIAFEGNNEIDEDDLKEGIELKESTVLSPPAIRRSIQKIRDLYAEKGFFLAEVESEHVAPARRQRSRGQVHDQRAPAR